MFFLLVALAACDRSCDGDHPPQLPDLGMPDDGGIKEPLDLAPPDLALDDDGDMAGGDTHPRMLSFDVARLTNAQIASPLAVADATGDGKPDVVALNTWDSQLVVLPGDGNAGFGAAISSPYTQYQPSLLAVGDLDGIWTLTTADLDRDGVLDLLVASGTTLCAYRGDGKGHFSGRLPFPGGSKSPVAAADFDGDGWPDIAAFDQRATWIGRNTTR